MIVDLYKSGMSLAELSSEYDIAKLTINGWIKDVKEIEVDENEVMALKEIKKLKKEMARIKEENDVELSLDEKRVLDFINKNKFITTKLCIETFGFGKTKSVSIFNRLIKLGLIKKVGSGSKISYRIVDEN